MIPTDPDDLAEGNKPLHNSCQACPNCQSKRFQGTIRREYCPDCTYEVDYWSGYCSPVEKEYTERRYWEERREEQERAWKEELEEQRLADLHYYYNSEEDEET